MCNIKLLLIFLFSVLFLHAQTYRYVTPTGGGSFDGTSWTNAYNGNNLQTAIDEAGVTDVWVAAGTYIPQSAPGLGAVGVKYNHFRMKNGVNIRGGFAGAEDPLAFDISTRDFITNETVLSADIGTVGDSTDNCYHVIYNCYGHGIPANNNQSAALDTTAVIDGFTITEGYATGASITGFGGGIMNYKCSAKIKNCTIKRNSANGASGTGGGVYNQSCSPVFRNCTFINNVGGDIISGAMTLSSCTNTIIDSCTFNSNTGHSGSAIYCSSGSALITNSLFNNNQATSGGTLYITSCTIVISNCTLNNNLGHNGGGITLSNAPNAHINSCSFSNNISNSSGDGGAIYNINANPVINNCNFSNNQATWGGGAIYSTGTSLSIITNCTFSNNYASNSGGAIWNFTSNAPTISNCTFLSNTTTAAGGAAYFQSSSPVIDKCLFYGNKGGEAGALFFYNNCNSVITNCIFNRDTSSNMAEGGGAIDLSTNSNITVYNSTFSNNVAGWGGAVMATSSSPTFINSVFWGNICTWNGNQINVYTGSLTLTNCCYQNGTNDIVGTPVTSNCITVDPKFVNQYGDDLHLSTDSPCLGTGISAGAPVTDYDGNARPNPVAANPDMGAYETTKIYSLDNLVTITSGPEYTFSSNNFSYPADNDFPFQAVRILSLPAAGTLKYNGSGVTTNTDYTDPTKLVFTCPPAGSGIPNTPFTFKVKNNQGNYSSPIYTMNIELPPDPPVISNMETTNISYIDGDIVAITDSLTITNTDDAALTSAVVQINGSSSEYGDTLLYTNVNGIVGSWAWDDFEGKSLRFYGHSNNADYQALLRSLMYKNNKHNPSALTRAVSITLNNGNFYSNTVTRNINIIKPYIPPFVTTNKPLNVDEGASAVISSTCLNAADSSYPGSLVTYVITKDPLYGLIINGNDTVTSSSHKFFNNNNIDSGYVRYVHNGSSFPADSFSFKLANKDSSVTSKEYKFIIDINNPPTVISKLPDLIIDKNKSLEIDVDTLTKHIKSHNNTSGQLVFTFQSKTGNITVDKNSDSTYMFTPIKDWMGTDTMKVIIADGKLSTDTTMLVMVSQVEGIEKLSNQVPKQFSLEQNYPNPFNPTTRIRFSIPQVKDNGGANVTLQIYDALGRKVITLLNNRIAAGTYETSFNAAALPSGIYFYRIIAGSFIQTKKMLLIK